MLGQDHHSNTVIGASPIGQGAQALAYVPDAVADGGAAPNLQPLGLAGMAAHLRLAPPGAHGGRAPTSVSLFDQGLTQVLEAAATGLEPKRAYILALSTRPDGTGPLSPLASFMTNPAGAAIVNAVGPIRQVVQGASDSERRYLVIAPAANGATPVQVQTGD